MTTPQDPYDRPPITDPVRAAIRDAFAMVPEGKSSAVLAIVDAHGPRLHAAWKVNDTWRVGAVINVAFSGKASGYICVEASW